MKYNKEINTKKQLPASMQPKYSKLNKVIANRTKAITPKTIPKIDYKIRDVTIKFKPQLAKERIYNIALLLPISGVNKMTGNSLLEVAEMAIFEINNPQLQINIYDTKSTIDGAKLAIDTALNEHKIDLILGPLSAQNTRAITHTAQENNLTILSLSDDSSLAKNKNTMVFGFLPEQEIKRVIEFALENNISQYSALLPRTEIGELIAQTLEQELDKYDIFLQQKRFYSNTQEDFTIEINNLIELSDSKSKKLVFTPENDFILDSTTQGLRVKENHLHLVGTSGWQNPEFVHNPQLIGSWFSSTNIKEQQNFNTIFKQKFNKKPSNIGSLIYDAIAIISLEINEQPQNITIDNFNNSTIYDGIGDKFSFDKQGLVQRRLNIYTIIEGGIEQID